MSNRNYGYPALVQLGDPLQYSPPAGRVKHGSGFVKNDHARFYHQHSGQGQALHLPSRKHVRRAQAMLPQVKHLQDSIYPLADFNRRHRQIFQPKGRIFLYQRRHDLIFRILKDHPHQLTNGAVQFELAGIHPGDAHIPRGGQV